MTTLIARQCYITTSRHRADTPAKHSRFARLTSDNAASHELKVVDVPDLIAAIGQRHPVLILFSYSATSMKNIAFLRNSARGKSCDNAVTESFFSSVKKERIREQIY